MFITAVLTRVCVCMYVHVYMHVCMPERPEGRALLPTGASHRARQTLQARRPQREPARRRSETALTAPDRGKTLGKKHPAAGRG